MTENSTSILLVEDDAILLAATADLLASEGFEVRAASGVGEAVELLEADEPPAAVITDINLGSERSGLELARLVSERWPEVRLLIVSGEQRPNKPDYPEGALFLTKPYPNEALLQLVRSEEW